MRDNIILILKAYTALLIILPIFLKFIKNARRGKFKRIRRVIREMISHVDNLNSIDSKDFDLKTFSILKLRSSINVSYFDYLWLVDRGFEVVIINLYILKNIVILLSIVHFIIDNITNVTYEVDISTLLIGAVFLPVTIIVTIPYRVRINKYIKNADSKFAINFLANWIYYSLKTNEYVLNRKNRNIGKLLFFEGDIIYSELGVYVISLKEYVKYEEIESIEFLQKTTNINLMSDSTLKSNYNEKAIYSKQQRVVIRKVKEELAKRLNDNCIYNIDEVINTLYYSDKNYIKITRVD